MEEPSDARLVEEARMGSRDAFAELVRRHERRVYGLALRMSGDPSEADDLAQEVFMSAWKAIGSFRGRSSFSTWLYRIAVNTSLTFLKRKGRERGQVPFDERLPARGPAGDRASGPEDNAAWGELAARAQRAVAGLPSRFRATFALVVDQGLSHAEAARVLGCAETTVSWRMHRARRLLRARLEPFLEEVRS